MTTAPTRTFWQDKKVFVTGHTGFKGAWLTMLLNHFGAKVYGYALPPLNPSLYRALDLRGLLAGECLADIGDRAKLAEFYQTAAPDITIHMAAQPLVLTSYEDPVETYRVNAIGTATLLDVIRTQARPQIVIVVTSDKVYENRETGHFYNEGDRLGGYDPYSASKACTELVARSFHQSFFKDAPQIVMTTARAGNVIGAGDWSEFRLIPDVMRAIAKNEPVVLRHPAAVRPWQHVLEPLTGYLLLAEKAAQQSAKLAGESFNFGPNAEDCQPVSDIVQKLVELSDNAVPVKHEKSDARHEAGLLHLDSTRARNTLGWQPRWDLQTTLSMTAQGYMQLRGATAAESRHMLNEQIKSYLD